MYVHSGSYEDRKNMFSFLFSGPQESQENEHLRVLRIELHKKYKQNELDGYGLYL